MVQGLARGRACGAAQCPPPHASNRCSSASSSSASTRAAAIGRIRTPRARNPLARGLDVALQRVPLGVEPFAVRRMVGQSIGAQRQPGREPRRVAPQNGNVAGDRKRHRATYDGRQHGKHRHKLARVGFGRRRLAGIQREGQVQGMDVRPHQRIFDAMRLGHQRRRPVARADAGIAQAQKAHRAETRAAHRVATQDLQQAHPVGRPAVVAERDKVHHSHREAGDGGTAEDRRPRLARGEAIHRDHAGRARGQIGDHAAQPEGAKRRTPEVRVARQHQRKAAQAQRLRAAVAAPSAPGAFEAQPAQAQEIGAHSAQPSERDVPSLVHEHLRPNREHRADGSQTDLRTAPRQRAACDRDADQRAHDTANDHRHARSAALRRRRRRRRGRRRPEVGGQIIHGRRIRRTLHVGHGRDSSSALSKRSASQPSS